MARFMRRLGREVRVTALRQQPIEESSSSVIAPAAARLNRVTNESRIAFAVSLVLGFGSSVQAQCYSLHDIGALPGGSNSSSAAAINNLGWVAGSSTAPDGMWHSFLWTPNSGMTDLGTLEVGKNAWAMGMNDLGQVVGKSTGLTPNDWYSNFDGKPFLWTPDQGMVQLPLGHTDRGAAFDINNNGRAVGVWYEGFPYGSTHPVKWIDPTSVSDLRGYWWGVASAISEIGQIVGYMCYGNGCGFTLWGSMPNFPPIPPHSFGTASSDGGTVAGYISDGTGRGFVASPALGFIEITPPDNNQLIPTGLNDSGVVVGSCSFGPMIWTAATGARRLQDLLDPSGSQWTLSSVAAINNAGQICGTAERDGVKHAVLLSPSATIDCMPGGNGFPTPIAYCPYVPPTLEQDKLIAITHGWNTTQADIDNFWNPFTDRIRTRMASEPDWQVRMVPWIADSGDPWPQFLSSQRGPTFALQMALAHGLKFGQEVGAAHYKFVHLIAHSAGSAFISQAALTIRQISPETIIHTTYLDAYAGGFVLVGDVGVVKDYQYYYGGNSDWSDHYFSQEAPVTWICDPHRTGPPTELNLSKSYNIDVTLVDPGYSSGCRSTHAWPRCFYSYTVANQSVGGCGVPFEFGGFYGFPMSYEVQHSSYTNVQGWITASIIGAPPGWHAPPLGGGTAGDEREGSELVYRIRQDVPIDMQTAPAVVSSPEAVQVTAIGLQATTQPPGSASPAPAWANIQVMAARRVNFISFDVEFTSVSPGAGLLRAFCDGFEGATLDEVHVQPGRISARALVETDLAPGLHVVGFRLDQMSQVPSSISVTNVATGWAGFVNVADLNADGVVDGTDLGILLGAWLTPTADMNGDGTTDGTDLGILLGSWST